MSTAYLAARAGYQTASKLANEDPYLSNKERAKVVWRFYIPPAASAAVTIVCIAGAKRVDAGKTLAAQTALAVVQQGYSKYREAVVEEFGEKRDQAILAKVAEDTVRESPPPAIIVGTGSVPTCELWTMRYFMSDRQTLDDAVNQVNAQMLRHDYATMDDFYHLMGLEYTPSSNHSGWRSDKLLELEYSSILHEGRPVMTFQYNYVTSL